MRTIDAPNNSLPGDDLREQSQVVEVGLLLDVGLLAALEAAARRQGVAPAAMVRRLLRDFVSRAGGEELEVASQR